MRIITSNPIIQVVKSNEQFMPFDGRTDLEELSGFDGEIIYCSADGENFYNAKGERLKGFFTKVGGGIVKGGKSVGKALRNVGKAIGSAFVNASKKVVSGVKTAGGKVKDGAKALLHHKTKEEKATSKIERDKKRANRIKEHENAKAKREKEIADAKAKGQTPPPPIPPLPPPTSGVGTQTGTEPGTDVFTKPLEKATPQTPPEKIVEVGGQKFSTENVEKGKEVVITTNETGNEVPGVQYAPSEVVAVTGKDGLIEYHTPDAVNKMTTTTKILIGVGIVLVIGTIIYLIIRNKQNGKVA